MQLPAFRAAFLAVLLPASALALAPPAHDSASQFPALFETLELPGDLDLPTAMAFAPDGVLFVAEKPGRVLALGESGLQSTPVIDLQDEVLIAGDRGILGMALHPGFAPDGGASSWLYLLYSVAPILGADQPPGQDDFYSFSRLTRYRVETLGVDLAAVLGSREILLGEQLPDGTAPDAIASLEAHPCGALRFGEDGSLLVSAGDGAHDDLYDFGGLNAGAFDTFTHPQTGLKGPIPIEQDSGSFRSQDLRSLCGKILRIDPETGAGYPSNPFFDGDPTSNPSRVWALGFRNPFRFAVIPGTGALDPASGQPGELFVGDVGSSAWEEVNRVQGGENFGWPCFEGPYPNAGYTEHTHQPNPLNYPDCGNIGPGTLTFPNLTWRQNDPNSLVPSGVYSSPPGSPFTGFTGSCSMGGVVYEGGEYPPEFDGRYFFADYAADWIRTLAFDPAGNLTLVEDFAFDVDGLVDMAVHPLTGDVHYVGLGSPLLPGHVYRIRTGDNFSPAVVASANPTFGPAPLTVQFSSAGSSDPEGDPLTFSWDFDDGSPLSDEVAPSHTFTAPGVRTVTLVANDGQNPSAVATVQVGVDESPPTARIVSPSAGYLFDAPETLSLVAEVSDSEGAVDVEWTVDLFHDTHIHPQAFVSLQLTDTIDLTPHTLDGELYYFRVTLKATDEAGLETAERVFVYPRENVADRTGRAAFVSRLHELDPPVPLGASNPDPEVLRDGDFPPAGSTVRTRQFDTSHLGEQGDDDWVGFALPYLPRFDARFVSLTFQEGLHTLSGGWWEQFDVEVRDEGEWSSVQNLSVDPPYPFELSAQGGFDGQNYDTYQLTFDPVFGDAIRLRGKPGGTEGYVSVGELRFEVLESVQLAQQPVDVTDLGETIASVTNIQAPPAPGAGSFLFNTLRNGTYPFAGDGTPLGSVATSDPAHPPGDHWFGYSFDTPVSIARVVFQEGLHTATGGWFETLDVEVRAPGGSWMSASGLTACPPYSPSETQLFSYESFVLDFDPVLVDGVRVIGQPGGPDGYSSVGELRVFAAGTTPACCGPELYGVAPGGSGQIRLRSSVPVRSQVPLFLTSEGAPGIGLGLMLITLGQANVLAGDLPVLVAPPTIGGINLFFDAEGRETTGPFVPFGAAVGLPVHFQVAWIDPLVIGDYRLSNGVTLVACP